MRRAGLEIQRTMGIAAERVCYQWVMSPNSIASVFFASLMMASALGCKSETRSALPVVADAAMPEPVAPVASDPPSTDMAVAQATAPEDGQRRSCEVSLLPRDLKSVTLLASPTRKAERIALRLSSDAASEDYLTLNVIGFSPDADYVEVEVESADSEGPAFPKQRGWLRAQDLPIIPSVLDKTPMADDASDTLDDHGLVTAAEQPDEASATKRIKTSALTSYRPFACQGRWLGMRKNKSSIWINSFCDNPYTMCP